MLTLFQQGQKTGLWTFRAVKVCRARRKTDLAFDLNISINHSLNFGLKIHIPMKGPEEIAATIERLT